MGTKWADYVITAVRFNSAGTHIEEVRVYEDNGDNIVNPATKRRSSVVTQLENGYTFCTATKSGENKWTKGAEVKIYTYEGEKFIKTRADGRKEDNLDNLPTF